LYARYAESLPEGSERARTAVTARSVAALLYPSVIPRFATAVLEGRTPTINGSGEISRDFTYVDNVVAANLLAARSDSPTGITCNVACGARYSLLELHEAIGEASGRLIPPTFGPARPGDIVHSQADISLARASLGYEPSVTFADGIVRTVAWYRDHLPGLAAAPSRDHTTGA
jgi:nucleoside-diphosphate-sugar epimerase